MAPLNAVSVRVGTLNSNPALILSAQLLNENDGKQTPCENIFFCLFIYIVYAYVCNFIKKYAPNIFTIRIKYCGDSIIYKKFTLHRLS